VAIQVNPDQLMSFGGSTDACAVCTFGNIGRIDNRTFSKQVMDKISKDLHISSSRFEFYGLLNLCTCVCIFTIIFVCLHWIIANND